MRVPTRQVERKQLDDQNTQIQQRILDLRQQVAQQRERLLQPNEIGVQSVIDSIRKELTCETALFGPHTITSRRP